MIMSNKKDDQVNLNENPDANAAGDNKTKKEKTKLAALQVHAKPARGFRRAGFEFAHSEPITLLVKDLKKEQIKALKDEPNLVVVETTVDAAE